MKVEIDGRPSCPNHHVLTEQERIMQVLNKPAGRIAV